MASMTHDTTASCILSSTTTDGLQDNKKTVSTIPNDKQTTPFSTPKRTQLSTATELRVAVKATDKDTKRNNTNIMKRMRNWSGKNPKIENASKITIEQQQKQKLTQIKVIEAGWENNSFNYDVWYCTMQRFLFSMQRPNIEGFDSCHHHSHCEHANDLYEIALDIKTQIETEGKLTGSLFETDAALSGSNNVQHWSEIYLKKRETLMNMMKETK